MKRLILSIAVIAMMAMTVTSCKSDAKKEAEEVKSEINTEDKEDNEIAKVTYQCPMKCEETKTYDEPGQCPVCKMDLKEVEENVEKLENKEDDDHDHGAETHEG